MNKKDLTDLYFTVTIIGITFIFFAALAYQPSMIKCEDIELVDLSNLNEVNDGTNIFFFDACKFDVVYIGQERGFHTFTLWQGNNMISMLKIIGIDDEYVQQKNNTFDFKIVALDETLTITVKDLWWK